MDEDEKMDREQYIDFDKVNKEEKVKIRWDDVVAIMIAQFQILMPLAIGAAVIISIVFIFLMKVWLRQ